MNNPAPQNPNRTVRTAGGAILIAASAGLMAFLGTWEGKNEYTVYADKLAGGIPTVCKGLTHHVTTTPIIVGEKWTPEKCYQEEQAAVFKVQTQLAKCFTRSDVPQQVFDMASSHAWNNGAANTCSSLAVKAFNDGDWGLGCRRLSMSDAGRPVWSFVRQPDGSMKFVQGLANRRSAETENCIKWAQELSGIRK